MMDDELAAQDKELLTILCLRRKLNLSPKEELRVKVVQKVDADLSAEESLDMFRGGSSGIAEDLGDYYGEWHQRI